LLVFPVTVSLLLANTLVNELNLLFTITVSKYADFRMISRIPTINSAVKLEFN